MTGFGLQNSTLNLDLQIPEEMAQHLALIAASNSLAENSECT